jgi:hypothetical protein
MALLKLDIIDYTNEIEASAEEVFAFFKQVEGWPSWAKGIKKAYRRPGRDWGVGFRLAFMPDFLPIPLDVKVIDFEEGRRIAWGVRSPVATLVHQFEFEPMGAGRCRVRHREYAEGLLAILVRPLRGKIENFDRGVADDLRAAFRKKA